MLLGCCSKKALVPVNVGRQWEPALYPGGRLDRLEAVKLLVEYKTDVNLLRFSLIKREAESAQRHHEVRRVRKLGDRCLAACGRR